MASARAMTTHTQSRRPAILVVDDSPENLDILKDALAGNYSVRPALHGTLALKLALKEPQPDLILLDVMMPGMDGYEVCQRLKADVRTRNIPVIFITAKTLVADEVKGLAVGGVDYIHKPISPPVVQARVKVHLDLQQAHRKTDAQNIELYNINKKLLSILDQLSNSEERFRNLVQTIPDIVYKIDADGRFTFINKAIERLGYQQAELIGQHFITIIHPTDRDRSCLAKSLKRRTTDKSEHPLQAFDERRTGDRITSGMELRLQSKSGDIAGEFEIKTICEEEIWAEVNSSGLYGKPLTEATSEEKRTYIGTVGVVRDITERKKIQEKLQLAKDQAEEATRIKDKFISMVAHDLRSPLGSILGSVQYVVEDEETLLNESHKTLLTGVVKNGQNLIQLIEKVLNIGRLKTGKITLEKIFFNGHSLIQEVAQSLCHLLSKKGLTLDNAVPMEMRLFADRILIGEVVQNLLSNAIKFSQPGSVIRVYAPDKKKAVIAVQDQGIGINDEIMHKLFNVEEKTSTPGTQGEQGTGFGLPFAFDLMQAHAGTLTVTSAPGKGSTFSLVLPTIKPCILIVDDEAATRTLLKQMLQALNVEVVEAGHGQEALQRIQEQPVHLILADLHMPIMHGFALLEKLQQHKETKTIPFVLMTVDQEMATRDRAFHLGAADFTVKPLQAHNLLPRIRYFIGG